MEQSIEDIMEEGDDKLRSDDPEPLIYDSTTQCIPNKLGADDVCGEAEKLEPISFY